MRVRFLERYGPYWPGADPVLEEKQAAELIALGVCEPFDKPPVVPATPLTEPTVAPEPEVSAAAAVDLLYPDKPAADETPDDPAPRRSYRRK